MLLQRSIQRRKMTFENKSAEIESYLAEIEEREKQWLDKDDKAYDEEPKSSHNQSAVPALSNQSKKNEINEMIQRDTQKLPNGVLFCFFE